MNNQDLDFTKTLAGKEYRKFLEDYDFHFLLDEDGEYFSCTVFKNDILMLAFTYEMNFGENVEIAELGAPVDAKSIAARSGGWSLVGEVWKDFYTELHAEKMALPYPHDLDRQREISLVDHALRELMSRVERNEISIKYPAYRMKI